MERKSNRCFKDQRLFLQLAFLLKFKINRQRYLSVHFANGDLFK